MQGSTSTETHFQSVLPPRFSSLQGANRGSVTVTSSEFQSKMQAARHRMVYALLKEEMSREGGIHALQLRTRTPEEERRDQQKAPRA